MVGGGRDGFPPEYRVDLVLSRMKRLFFEGL
jgi:hypothetical protein